MTSPRSVIRGRLLALQAALTARHIATRLDPTGLAVMDGGGQQVDTITVWPWPPDQDAYWYFDCAGNAVASAADAAGAADATITAMRQSGIDA